MRFIAGVVVGIVIGPSVVGVVNDHLTPPVRRKIAGGLHRVANRLHVYASNSPFLAEEDQK